MKVSARDLELEIKQLIDSTGIFNRIFTRVKDKHSIERKIRLKKYKECGKKMQDLIGIRIVLYFNDDIEFIKKLLISKYNLIEIVHDKNDTEQFGPTRLNLIFELPEHVKRNLSHYLENSLIDSTFEVQIRSVLSEGWHEVEHDLRYKCKEEWENFTDESRRLNSILATLENCDWSVRKLFDELAYKNYKKKNVQAMMKNKFRLRFGESDIMPEILNMLEEKPELLKLIYRANRTDILNEIQEYKLIVNYNNIIFVINKLVINDDSINNLTPPYLFNQ